VRLCHSLSVNSSLTEICLANNKIGDTAATTMGTALKENSTLATLDLACCGISGNGCAALFNSLCRAARTISLSELSLSHNMIHVKCAEALGTMLTVVTSLTKLNIMGCVGEKGCAAVCKGIANNSSLRELDLRGFRRNLQEGIHDVAKDAIVTVVVSNTCIIKILNNFGLEERPVHEHRKRPCSMRA